MGQFLTYAAIIIDSEDGSFRDASWVEAPARYVQVGRNEARDILLQKYPDLKDKRLYSELIWEPGDISSSPFYPYWKIIACGRGYLVTQNKDIVEVR
ncbi:MAG: hypothetical protein NT033_00175, partial [Candidatus Omnitrophica bacterium]|nr:hypothetical protein [Candidatus Omnitrophota bacterium]